MTDSVAAFDRRVEPARIEATVAQLRAQGWLDDDDPAVLVHDLSLLRARAEQLQQSFPAASLHAAAIKANPAVSILSVLVEAGMGMEAASWEEVELALAAGCTPDRIVLDSPAKTRADLRRALDRGVRLNLDNLDELDRVAALEPGSDAHVGLRVNPAVGAGTIRSTSVADRGSRFGVPWPQTIEPLVDCFVRHAWLDGLHVHVGSQGCSLQQLVSAVRKVLELRAAIEARVGQGRIRWVDIGGGLPADYGRGHDLPSLDGYVAALRRETPELFSGEFQVVTEFGRALQVGCGFAVSRVEYAGPKGERRMATIHVGADLLPRTAYAPNDWPHELLVLDEQGRQRTGQAEPWTVLGPLCFAGDVVARDRPLPPIVEGDHLVIRDVGGYTMGMWSRHCSRGMPPVLGLTEPDEPLVVLRPRETYEDIVRFWGGRP
ncbi:MAG: diaminopimelate decarboxylase [Myxococcota bacterium]